MILKETTVGWTLEHSYSDGGTPSPYPIPLEGQLSLLDATDSEALIQSRRLIQSDKVKGEISVERALYHWELNNGLTLLWKLTKRWSIMDPRRTRSQPRILCTDRSRRRPKSH